MTILISTNDIFARRLNDLMVSDDISCRELCKQACIQRKSLYSWLSGRYYPRYDALIRLADYFKVSINFLLGISDDEYSPERCAIEEVPKQFRSKLFAYMEEKSLTKYALAKKISIGQSTLARWFECNSFPDTSLLIRISKVTGLSVDFLLGYN